MRGLALVVVLAGGTSIALASPQRAAPPKGGAEIRSIGDPLIVTGDVTETHARWTSDGSRIVTEASVMTAQGPVTVSQLGGTANGLGMIQFPSPPILAAGMRATVTAHAALDRRGISHVIVDDAQIAPGPRIDWVRTGPTAAGHYLYWESGCSFATPDAGGTAEIAGSDEFPIIADAIATWNTDVDTSTCSYIKVVENAPEAREVGNDGVNLIKFRDTSWCRPAVDDDPARCYSDSAAGITTATFVDDASSPRDGAIVDADIEINGVNFAISIAGVTLGSAACDAELQNTLTHELGHLHGLEHTCRLSGDPPRVDNTGSAVPYCADTSDPAILDATMYPYQDCGETTKETLSADDIAAICAIYPVAEDPGTCAPPAPIGGAGCCDAAPGTPAGSIALALLVLAKTRRRRSGAHLRKGSTLLTGRCRGRV